MPESSSVARRTLVSSALAAVGTGLALGDRSRADRAAAATPPSGKLTRVDRVALAARLDAHRIARGGTMGLVVHDHRFGRSFSWRPFTTESFSTIKVIVLIACLKKCQDSGMPLTATRHTQAARMIQSSDNDATDALIAWVGAPSVQRAATLLGMRNTVVRGAPAGAGWWGYSTTTAVDLVLAMDALTLGTTVINAANRAYIRNLMAGVVSSQRWGVSDPPLPTIVRTETKNGWDSMSGGYRLNSMGYVLGEGRNYTMAILTRSPQGFTYGKTTINGLSTIVYQALARPL